MPSTTSKGIPYPVSTDNNDVPTDMANIANWINPVVGGLTSAQISALTGAALWNGRRHYDTDRRCFRYYSTNTAEWIDEQALVMNTQSVATYTLVLSDASSKLIKMFNVNPNVLSVPTDAAVPFPIGTVINIAQTSVGQVTVSAATPATTSIRCTPGPKLRTQYSTATLVKIGTDEWLLSGDVTA